MHLLDELRRMAWDAMSGPLDPGLEFGSGVVAEVPPWQFSSFELLNGVEVTDFSETITGEAFQDLFLR